MAHEYNTNSRADTEGVDDKAVKEMLARAADAHGLVEACIRQYGRDTMHQVYRRVWHEYLRNGEVAVDDVVEGDPPDMLCDTIRLLAFFVADPTGATIDRGRRDRRSYERE